MAIKREDERYSSDPLDEISGMVERVEGKKQQDSEDGGEAAPALRMKVLGDMRDTGKKRRPRDES